MTKTIILFVGFLSLVNLSSAQQEYEKITRINFTLIHSRRIPHAKVEVIIRNRPENCTVQVKSIPRSNETRWENTSIDTSFLIPKETFYELSQEVWQLNNIDLNKAFSSGGLDGTTCIIEFGTYGASISYHFWSPMVRTEFRGLSNFLAMCNRLLLIANLDPKEIM